MNQLQKLIKERSDIQSRMDVLLEAIEGNEAAGVQSRSLSETESQEIVRAKSRMEELKNEISNLEFLEKQKTERAFAGVPKGIEMGEEAPSEFEKALKGFSISRAAKQVASGRLDGLEKEVNQETTRMAAECGIPTRGGIMVPFAKPQSRADNGIGSASGNLISTELFPSEQGYKIKLFAEELGARVVRNLTGIKDIPVIDLIAEAAYAAETGALTEIDPTVRLATLTPKPVVAKISMTNLLMASAGVNAVMGLAGGTLEAAEGHAVEKAIINGSGSAPTGIFGNTDVPNLDLSVAGNIDYYDLLKLKNNPGKNNSRFVPGKGGWVTNEDVRTLLESTQHGTSGRYIWPVETPDMLMGHKAVTTSLIPNDGGAGDDESGVIFGIWPNLVVANWAFRELVLDKVTEDSITWFKWYSYWCHALISPKAFAKCRNIKTVLTT